MFESVNQEYFLNKTGSKLCEFARNQSVNNYLEYFPVPTTSEDDVQDWLWKIHTLIHTLKDLSQISAFFFDKDVTDDVYIPTFVHTLLEVKERKNMSGLADEDKGQLVDYMNVLIKHQPLRKHYALFLWILLLCNGLWKGYQTV